ncbi:MAG: LCP family protein, partial [Anaerolineae bacterium]|nr:LCP family protein [Anaerolineae bacterium]
NANFGIRIDYYIMINFTVFESVVDIIAPDGVEIEVTETIRDDYYPDAGFGTIPVAFDPGIQRMNGERLLQYARTRATENSDLDRARRQQQTIEALRSQVLSSGGVQALLTSIPSLWNELSGSYRTNLNIQQIIGLGYLMNEISRENIRYQVIGVGYVQPGQTPDGTQQILIPIHSRIQDLIAETFFPDIGEVTIADLRVRAEIENAAVRVYNGTQIQGLAGRTQEYLLGQGIRVNEIGNVPNPTKQPTVILDYGGGRDTARWVAAILGLSPDRIQIGSDGLAVSGIIIVTGSDMESIMRGQ